MSGPPRQRSTNIIAEPENKAPKHPPGFEKPDKPPEPRSKKYGKRVASSVLRQKSMNASFSSDVSSESSSSSSTGRSLTASTRGGRRRSGGDVGKNQCGGGGDGGGERECVAVEEEIGSGNKGGCFEIKKRCAWVTPTSAFFFFPVPKDACYVTFHDEEWGVPVHDDKKLFELLSLSGALAELAWPVILSKRNLFREVFLDFDPIAVSKLSEKKIASTGSTASSLLSEIKLRSVIENARQMCKVIDEFGSFNKYIWNFVNNKPIVNQFRYSRQVPVKTSKAELISKDLVRRGFRSVGPTVIYSFMQVAGLTIDHLISCFRFQACISEIEEREVSPRLKIKTEEKEPEDVIERGLIDTLGDHSCSKQLFKAMVAGS
ncbi:hypothetical protein Tsubulata_026089 [Turnera subulata]|uniref:Uncharacterized protein n=1 Tax=Turnera subulata TaxID=218843 RepID=A0A9Q0F1H4_9ROSI|nr:hypothetical protein Tsubulata_026089 [Turnera subulata]